MDLSNTPQQVDTSMDSVVIRKVDHDIPGGKALDTTGVSEEVLKAGRVVIEHTASGTLKPLAISGGAYASLPDGHTFKGILVATVLKSKPGASIMIAGSVNGAAAVNYGLPAYTSTIKNALTRIIFTQD